MASKEEELENLFKRWKEKQVEEKDWKKTTVGGREILRKHFTKDGMVDAEAYEKATCKVLVVLKEANIADNKSEEWIKKHPDGQRVWYREFANGTVKDGVIFWENEKSDNNAHQKEVIGRMAYLVQQYSKNKKVDGIMLEAEKIQNAVK